MSNACPHPSWHIRQEEGVVILELPKHCELVLTAEEFRRAIHRGKARQRRRAHEVRVHAREELARRITEQRQEREGKMSL